ncbi:MAG: hypothetical protein C0618_09650 [Desulfuromonas sp.]|nr:MAG: hypothetical protein C0618_09650 [Desulfuromonas sp.]
MKAVVPMLLLVLLMGCTAVTIVPRSYFPQGQAGPEYEIGARLVHGLYRDRLVITVNQVDVLSGETTLWRPYSSMQGTYQEIAIRAHCTAKNRGIEGMTRYTCVVTFDDRLAARLVF